MKRAALIGLGDVSQVHVQAIRTNNARIALAAVCDTDEAAAGVLPGVPFYTDYRRMIEEVRPDVVHICLPHYLHVPVSMEAARMGVHVFCEKPMALNTEQAEEFVAFEARNPAIHIGICLQNRLNESVEMLKSIIDAGTYGRVVATKGIVPWARPREYYEVKPWRGKWETAGGGCMINQSIHTLDLLYYLGGEISRVKASVSQLLDYGIEVEDTVSARLDYAGGARGLFMATNANYKNECVQIGIRLEGAEFQIMDNILYRLEPDGTKKLLVEDRKLPGMKFYYGVSHEKLIRRFYDALEARSQDYIHVADALMSIRLIDAIQTSGRSGAAVTV